MCHQEFGTSLTTKGHHRTPLGPLVRHRQILHSMFGQCCRVKGQRGAAADRDHYGHHGRLDRQSQRHRETGWRLAMWVGQEICTKLELGSSLQMCGVQNCQQRPHRRQVRGGNGLMGPEVLTWGPSGDLDRPLILAIRSLGHRGLEGRAGFLCVWCHAVKEVQERKKST